MIKCKEDVFTFEIFIKSQRRGLCSPQCGGGVFPAAWFGDWTCFVVFLTAGSPGFGRCGSWHPGILVMVQFVVKRANKTGGRDLWFESAHVCYGVRLWPDEVHVRARERKPLDAKKVQRRRRWTGSSRKQKQTCKEFRELQELNVALSWDSSWTRSLALGLLLPLLLRGPLSAVWDLWGVRVAGQFSAMSHGFFLILQRKASLNKETHSVLGKTSRQNDTKTEGGR